MTSDRIYTFLLLEDDQADAFLLKRKLQDLLPKVELLTADDQASYESLLKSNSPEIILSDYRLPQYSGIEALMYARVHAPVVPFIFVTGALNNEELAADTILKGASGFVLKNNLDKLDTLLPPLLNATSPPRTTGPATSATPTSRKPSAAPSPDLNTVMDELVEADPETLAEIRRMLAQKRAGQG